MPDEGLEPSFYPVHEVLPPVSEGRQRIGPRFDVPGFAVSVAVVELSYPLQGCAGALTGRVTLREYLFAQPLEVFSQMSLPLLELGGFQDRWGFSLGELPAPKGVVELR